MRTLLVTVAIAGLLISFSGYELFAQGKGKGKGKNKVKLHAPPPWAPAHGFHKRHIYFPDYLCYYDCHKGTYLYFKNNAWITVSKTPLAMEKVDMKAVLKIEIDLDDDVDFPQQFFEEHRKVYPKSEK